MAESQMLYNLSHLLEGFSNRLLADILSDKGFQKAAGVDVVYVALLNEAAKRLREAQRHDLAG